MSGNPKNVISELGKIAQIINRHPTLGVVRIDVNSTDQAALVALRDELQAEGFDWASNAAHTDLWLYLW